MKVLHHVFRLLLPVVFLAAPYTSIFSQCISGNCQYGSGVYRYSGISKYTGQFQHNLRHGKGKMTYPDGNVYEGSFVMGKKQGPDGSVTFAVSGDKYVGEWKNDLPNGNGTYYFTTKQRYEGNFVNGNFEGSGTMYYPDGAMFTGHWSKNKKNGPGVYRDAHGVEKNNLWAMGQLVKKEETAASNNTPAAKPTPTLANNNVKPDVTGLRNCGASYCSSGQGYYNYPEGSIWVGNFKEGYPSGQGICYYANGDRYEGEWANNRPNGEGVMHYLNGRVYGAVWMNGGVVSELDSRETVPTSPVKIDKNLGVKVWAVVVGVGKYSSMPSLKYTDDDAFRFYSHLKSPEGGALPDNQIEILVDEAATRENILRTMRQYFLRADENDVVLLYFSGHGLEGCFLPVDYDGYNNKLRHEEIRQIFKESKAKHKICIADACHSGTLDYSGTLAAKGPAPVSVDRYYQAFEDSDGGIALLMSSQGGELSLEDQGLRQGVFTYYILQGMKGGADTNSDYIVTVTELYAFVHKKVLDYTAGMQSPALSGDYDENMPVSLRTR
jgi:hypothetical protein